MKKFLLLLIHWACGQCLLAPAADDSATGVSPAHPPPPKKIAAIVSAYYQNSHADVIVSRLLETQTLDGQGEMPGLKLVSLYTDKVPANDKSRKLAAQYHFPIYGTIEDALTLKTGKLAVDGVLLVAEHGQYSVSDTGQTMYPKRRLFEQIIQVFTNSHRVVPVYVDKHLADNWRDAKWLYDTAGKLKIPLMAGSSLPTSWRYPPVDVRRGAVLKEIVVVSYHTLDAYGFHALEILQSLAERRRSGETGIQAVRCLAGDAVWDACEKGGYDGKLLEAALGRLRRPAPRDAKLRDLVREPVLFVIDYRDGLRANVFTLNPAVAEWAAAWRYADDDRVESTLFWTQEARPFMHFAFLVQGVEILIQTGKAPWPVERTLLTSGTLDALLRSRKENGKRLETDYLNFSYRTDWDWKQPPAPPPGRPLDSQ